MTPEDKLERLWDRQQIRDCLHRYPRAIDRHDIAKILLCFHEDAVDEHGHDVNGMPDFAYWANQVHEESFGLHLHNLTTHNCEIEGNTATCETYVLVGLNTKDNADVWLIGGRYLDRLEKRAGEWRIAFRRTLIDWVSSGKSLKNDPRMQGYGYPEGTWDLKDPSYARPLTL